MKKIIELNPHEIICISGGKKKKGGRKQVQSEHTSSSAVLDYAWQHANLLVPAGLMVVGAISLICAKHFKMGDITNEDILRFIFIPLTISCLTGLGVKYLSEGGL